MVTHIDNKRGLTDFLNANDPFDVDPLSLPVELAGSAEWDYMDRGVRSRVLGGMLRHTVRRAKNNVGLYAGDERWQNVKPSEINDISDILELPMISKDSVPGTGSPRSSGIIGFRGDAIADPALLLPDNLLSELLKIQEGANKNFQEILDKYGGAQLHHFGSGGSMGASTDTILTYLTVETEAHSLARCLRKNGMKSGQSIACFYNDTHKGGLQLQRAADIMGMPFHSKKEIFESILNDSRYGDAMRKFMKGDESSVALVREGIRDYIRGNKIQVVESVQPPDEFINKNAKGSALSFMSIYEEEPEAFSSVEHIFLTGFPVPESAYGRLRQDGKVVSTTWGSTETMALATYPEGYHSQNVNDLEENLFPTVGKIARYRERGYGSPQLVEVPVEEKGLLLVTSLLGAGSVYINYLIGDIATRTEKGYRNIDRGSPNPDIAGSCAADALSLE